jgi:HlyD family secretion protein
VTGRVWLAVVVLLLLAAGGGIWWWSERPPPAIVWQGYAEADFVMVGPTQQGLLTAVFVARGDAVAIGAPLFTQDETDDQAARDQAAQMLAQAEKQLANLQQAASRLKSSRPRTTWRMPRNPGPHRRRSERGEALLPKGDVTKQSVDQLRADHLSAQAKVERVAGGARAVARTHGPGRRDQAQRKAWRAARRARHGRVAARATPRDRAGGRARRRRSRPPGRNHGGGRAGRIAAAAGNIFVRFFVPERQLSTVHAGDPVTLACDGCPADLSATISFISPQAEYTPPLIYSESSNAKLVFLVEARPPLDQAAKLNPGEPMEVRPLGGTRRRP